MAFQAAASPRTDPEFERLKALLSDWRWRLNNLYYIIDQDGRRIQFKMNWAQELLYSTMHYSNVILKARQLGFCLDPTTKVLTADLRWIEIQHLAPGDRIVSADESAPGGKGNARRMRTATVQGVVSVAREAYRITFDDGRSVVCTGRHPWLSRKAGSGTDWRWIDEPSKRKLNIGTHVRWVTKPWGEATFDDGWFGGMLDGEGSMSRPNVAASVNVSQRPGPVWERLLKYVEDRGYNHCIEIDAAARPSKHGTIPVPKIAIGRMDELFRLIGQTRPTRFLGNEFWEGRELPGKRNGGVGWATVVKIEPLGERRMIDLQTSTGTYIAEGFVSHNTTFIQIFMLDACVFNSNIRAGTIAHTLPDAQIIFRDKVRYPYDNLPDQIRAAVSLRNDNATELVLSNNSSVRVGTSMRSGTLQYLHISEYGKICAKFPDKAREIRTGALNTVTAGQVVFIESTAEGQEGDFFDTCQRAQSSERMGAALTPMDYKFFFFPWWKHRDYRLDPDGVTIPDHLVTYFGRLAIEQGIPLTAEQKAWYVKKHETQQEDMKREFPSTPEEAFEASMEGAYYARQIAEAEQQQRIGEYPFDPALPVHTAWDIGMDDSTTIWLWQVFRQQIRLIGYYENSGEFVEHYVLWLNDWAAEHGARFGDHWLPHDVKVREWGSTRSRVESLIALGIRPRIVPDIGLEDGINAVRSIFRFCWFDEGPCASGLKSLKAYRKEWNETHGVWASFPRKDKSCHGADGFRMMAVAYRQPQEPAPPKPVKDLHNATVDELWALNRGSTGQRRRI